MDKILRAQVAIARSDLRTARSALETVPSGGRVGAQREYLLGRLALGEYHAREAEVAFRRALDLDPELSDARRALIYILGIQVRRRETLEQFAELAERGPMLPALVQDWCVSHDTIGDPAKVVPDLRKIVEADPGDNRSRLALADAYRQLGQYEEAAGVLAYLDPAEPDTRSALAELATARGDMDEARQLLEDGPIDHPGLARQRGMLALARRDYAGARENLERADQAESNCRDVILGLGLALRGLGETKAADRLVERATAQHTVRTRLISSVDHPPSSPEEFCELGRACESAGWNDEARAWYRLAVAASPTDAAAQEALYRLRTP
ncbi:MAG: tetratricopeptide repeat protein [Isosphaeraceae bacterium]